MTDKEFNELLEEAFILGYKSAEFEVVLESYGDNIYKSHQSNIKKELNKKAYEKLVKAAKVLIYRDKEKYKGLMGIIDWVTDHPVQILIGRGILEIVNEIIVYIANNITNLDVNFLRSTLELLENSVAGILTARAAKKQFDDMCNDYNNSHHENNVFTK